MKKLLFSAISAGVFLLASCGGESDTPKSVVDPDKLTEAQGGKYYGKVFTMNESDNFKNLFPHSITDAISYRIANQIYEGLLKFSQDSLNLVLGIAEKYEVDTSQTVYTFKLRKGVFFHDNECFPGGKGREVKTSDVKYCFTQLCTFSTTNQGYSALAGILKGSGAYFKATQEGKSPGGEIEGIKVIDDYTIQFLLEAPNSMFLYNLARPYTYIFPKEAVDKYGAEMRTKAVGTGPFKVGSMDETVVTLKRNDNYYLSDDSGNKLPYLAGLKIRFLKDKKTELFEFQKQNLNMMYRLPTDYLIEIEESTNKKEGKYAAYTLQRNSELATHMLCFLNNSTLFGNKDLRKALSFAIDRKKILEMVLNGEGFTHGQFGITPPEAFKDYDVTKIKGYKYQMKDSAVFYLKKAGYKRGKDVPKLTLDLNSDGDRNMLVASEVAKQIKDVLDIEVTINPVVAPQHFDNVQSGRSDFFRIGWFADYPSPEAFLWFFYSKDVPKDKSAKSYPNLTRYSNPEFDLNYEAAIRAKTREEANAFFMKAEQIAVNDCPVIVLWYDEAFRLLQSDVVGLPNNAMQYRDFTRVHFIPPTKDNKKK